MNVQRNPDNRKWLLTKIQLSCLTGKESIICQCFINYFSLARTKGFHSVKADFQSWENRSFKSTNSYYTKFWKRNLYMRFVSFLFQSVSLFFCCVFLCFMACPWVVLCSVFFCFFRYAAFCCTALYLRLLCFVVLSLFAFCAYFCNVFCCCCCCWRRHSSEVSETILSMARLSLLSSDNFMMCR